MEARTSCCLAAAADDLATMAGDDLHSFGGDDLIVMAGDDLDGSAATMPVLAGDDLSSWRRR